MPVCSWGWKTQLAFSGLIIAIIVNLIISKKTPSPVLEIENGKIQGVESYTRGGKKIYEYRRIPFAEQPIGDLRFEPPQPAKSWTGVLDATQAGPQCLQINTVTRAAEGVEACLFLNVFTPVSRSGLLPVMVYIHGGGFTSGSANSYNPGYLLDENVILVTTNYRLASLGFLNTGGSNGARGNQGLKDQNLALKWVQKNIKYFGGDPDQVTLFGESAGSMSVGYHLISPMSKGLFSRAIMQSGSPLGNWALNRDSTKQSKHFAAKFECPVDNTKELVDCLKNVDGRTLMAAHLDSVPLLKEKITLFVPSVEAVQDDNTFIGEDPKSALLAGRVNKVPLIAGLVENEGLLVSSVIISNQTILRLANDDWFNFVPLSLDYDPKNRQVSEEIRQFYFPNANNIASANYLDGYTNMNSDRKFIVPTHDFVKEYAKYASVRMYVYSYSGEFSLGDLLAASQSESLPGIVSVLLDLGKRWVTRKLLGYEIPHLGICHADELQLLFDWQLSSYISESHNDYDISKKMVKLWADFAKNRETLTFDNIIWPVLDMSPPFQYLNISLNPKLVKDPFNERIQFWQKLGI